jgi:deazaflavin-dependent oxidoreductase (nitroreductase family)
MSTGTARNRDGQAKSRSPAGESTPAARPRPKKTWLQRAGRRIGNPLRMWPLRMGLPSPPYTRRNAIIVETIGRRSGKRRRMPVGFLEENGKLIVVVEDGLHASWVRNGLAADGHLRVFLYGRWRDARLEPRRGDPEAYLRRMNRVHAAFVHAESSVPALVEITPE